MHSIYEIGVPSSTNAGIYEAFLFVANKTLFFPLFVVGSQNSAVSRAYTGEPNELCAAL